MALPTSDTPPLGAATSSIAFAQNESGDHRFILAARCAMTRSGARIFIGIMALPTFFIAGLFTLQGFWPVLPFAGLEIGALAWALKLSMRSGQDQDVITIMSETVVIEQFSQAGTDRAVFPRHWCGVKLRRPRIALHPSRLTLGSHGRSCEVGRFLTEDERRELAVRLKQLIGNVNQSPAL
jgi:uncharacterized membrane protein